MSRREKSPAKKKVTLTWCVGVERNGKEGQFLKDSTGQTKELKVYPEG